MIERRGEFAGLVDVPYECKTESSTTPEKLISAHLGGGAEARVLGRSSTVDTKIQTVFNKIIG
jgi:hypothetical protein